MVLELIHSTHSESKRMSVLLIEDNFSDILLFQEALKSNSNYTKLEIARDGEEAINFFQNLLQNNQSLDLILLDLNLPKLNGFEVLKYLKSHDDLCGIPVVILSGSTNPMDVVKSYQSLASSVIKKPTNFEGLERIVSSLGDYRELFSSHQLNNRLHANNLPILNGAEPIPKKITLPTSDGIEYITIDKILRVEADRSYCKFHLLEKRILHVSKPLSSFEPILLGYNFFRVHKSNLVNGVYIEKYVKSYGGYIELTDGSHITVASRRKEELFAFMEGLSLESAN